MRRIAVCISGQPRTWRTALKNSMKFFNSSGAQVDYFYHTWKDTEDCINPSVPQHKRNFISVLDEIPKINKLLSPKKYAVDPVLIGRHEIYNLNDRWMNIFYSMGRSIQLKKDYEIEHNFTYDLVVKSRFDIIYNPEIDFPDMLFDIPSLYMLSTHCEPMQIEYGRYNFNDIVMFSNSISMDIMSSVFQRRLRTLRDAYQRVPGKPKRMTDALSLGPGTIMYNHIVSSGLKPMTFFDKMMHEYQEYIVREDSDIDPCTAEGFGYYVNKHWEWYNQ